MVTGSWVRALTTASAALGETTTTFYDTRSRAVRTRTQNHLGGYTNTNSSLDFTGKSLYTITKHKRTSGDTELTIREEYTYSPQDHLLTHTHQINGGTVEVLANNTYDDLGQLSVKNVGNSAGTPLQKVHYSYNIRGWLTGINNVEELQQDTDPKDLFAFKINYDKVEANANFAKALYNGNIAETSWITNSDVTGAIRIYGYQYDQLNRLLEATYQTPNLADNKNYFGESMDYDKNGNITRLQRQYMAGVSSNPYVGDMDILGYFYETNSNRLMKVTDTSNQLQGFKDDSNGFNDSGDDYAYDLNGNLMKDENKNITQIQYNHLNLPKKITFGTPGRIEYIYNAAGQKLEKFVKDRDGVVIYTDYLGGFQYSYSTGQNIPVDPVEPGGGEPDPPAADDPGNTDPPVGHDVDPDPKDPPAEANRFSAFAAQSASQAAPSRPTLEFFPTAEGYYDYIGKKYVYQYKDHLGNIRLSYAKNPATQVLTIIDENNYYPFGLKHKGYNDYVPTSNKYKYNGKELQDELGLGVYDMEARNYMPDIGRWGNIDALAESFFEFSPYSFSNNNPIYFSDPTGLSPEASTFLSATFINGAGKVVEHRNDGDDNVYLVDDDWEKGGSKKGLPVVGKEKPGMVYTPGLTYQFDENLELTTPDFGSFRKVNGSATPVGGAFDIFGFWDAFYTELFSEIGGDSPTTALAFAVVTKGKAKPSTSIRALTGLLKAGKLHKHHVLSQQFRKWFASRGIKNIDDYTIQISAKNHLKSLHGQGKWNQQWADFIKANPSASPSQIFYQAESMLAKHGLEHSRYVPYK